MQTFKILIVNDSFVERFVLKSIVFFNLQNPNLQLSILTSQNSVEALGAAFILKPDMIIIDSTLPKLSGGELAWFLNQYKERLEELLSLQTIVTIEKEDDDNVFEEFIVFSKGNKTFLQNILKLIQVNVDKAKFSTDLKAPNTDFNKSNYLKYIGELGNKAIFWENQASFKYRQDSLNKVSPVYKNLFWFLRKINTELYFVLFLIFAFFNIRKVPEDSIEQQNKDLSTLRVLYYPKIIFGVFAIVLVAVQVFAFFSGTSTLLGSPNFSFFQNTANNSNSNEIEIEVLNLDNQKVEGALIYTDGIIYSTDADGYTRIPVRSIKSSSLEVRYEDNIYYFLIEDINTSNKLILTINDQ